MYVAICDNLFELLLGCIVLFCCPIAVPGFLTCNPLMDDLDLPCGPIATTCCCLMFAGLPCTPGAWAHAELRQAVIRKHGINDGDPECFCAGKAHVHCFYFFVYSNQKHVH